MMRKIVRLAAISGIGVLALTACGDDAPVEQNNDAAEGQESTQQSESNIQGWEAQELMDLAADEDHFGGEYGVTCNEDLSGEPGHFVTCAKDDDDGEMMFSVTPDDELIMRDIGVRHDEPSGSDDDSPSEDTQDDAGYGMDEEDEQTGW